jgi:hypothetical protein
MNSVVVTAGDRTSCRGVLNLRWRACDVPDYIMRHLKHSLKKDGQFIETNALVSRCKK